MPSFFNPALAELIPYTPGEQPQDKPYIKLNTNESPYPPAPGVLAAVKQEVGRLNLYPNPACAAVIEPLAARLGVEKEQVFVSNGSDETLAFCFQGFCPQGVAFADITYGFYPVYSALYGVTSQIIPLREDFSLAPEDYVGLGKTIFIANPNAPTGLALSRAQIEGILRNNPQHLVVIDEAYVDFGAESTVPLLQNYSNLLVVGTFSKSRGLAGARLGFAAGSKQLIADLNRIKFSFNPYNVNRMTLAAGAASLADDDYFKHCCQRIQATRTSLQHALQAMGFGCSQSMTNFVFASHPKLPAETLYQGLQERGILVRWFNVPRIQNHLRITVGTKAETVQLCCALEQMCAP